MRARPRLTAVVYVVVLSTAIASRRCSSAGNRANPPS